MCKINFYSLNILGVFSCFLPKNGFSVWRKCWGITLVRKHRVRLQYKLLVIHVWKYTCSLPVANCNLLHAELSGVRIPVEAEFPAPLEAGLETYAAFCATLSAGYGGKGRWFDHPPTSSAEAKESVKLHLFSLCVPQWQVIGWPSLYFILANCSF